MAATVDSSLMITNVDHPTVRWRLSAITAGTTTSLTAPTGTPDGVEPYDVRINCRTMPTNQKAPALVAWSYDSSTNAITVRLDNEGSDLAACVLDVLAVYNAQASGGISA